MNFMKLEAEWDKSRNKSTYAKILFQNSSIFFFLFFPIEFIYVFC